MAERPAPASEQRHGVPWMLASIISKHWLLAAMIMQQETEMTLVTRSVSFRAAKKRDCFQPEEVRLHCYPRNMDVHLEVACSILPKPAFFWHPNTYIPLDLTDGNFPNINISAWDSDPRTFPVGDIDSRGADRRSAHTLFSATATPLGKGSSRNYMEFPPSPAAGSLGSYTAGPIHHYPTHRVTTS